MTHAESLIFLHFRSRRHITAHHEGVIISVLLSIRIDERSWLLRAEWPDARDRPGHFA